MVVVGVAIGVQSARPTKTLLNPGFSCVLMEGPLFLLLISLQLFALGVDPTDVSLSAPAVTAGSTFPPPHPSDEEPPSSSAASSSSSSSSDSGVFRGKKDFGEDEAVRALLKHGSVVAALLHLVELTLRQRDSSRPCERLSFADFKYELSGLAYSPFAAQTKSALKTANILNNLFIKASVANDTSDLLMNELLYYSLVKANVEGEPSIVSSSVAMYRDDFPPSEKVLFIPHAFRQDGLVGTKDLGKSSPLDRWQENDWFWGQASKNFTDIILRKFGVEYGTIVTAIMNGTADLLVGPEDGLWTLPYYDCGEMRTWLTTYSAPFFAQRGGDIAFRGVATISIDLRKTDINQCAMDQSLFAGTHKCDRNTTECVPLHGRGFRRGSYRCRCKLGYYYPSDTGGSGMNYFTGMEVEEAYVNSIMGKISGVESSTAYPDDFRCLSCPHGCESCLRDSPCYVEYSVVLRSLVLGFQSFCSTITIILGVVVFCLRKSKMFTNAMWIMLETILFGALLVYQTVIIRYFEPSTLTCMIEPWFRELGFAICYGAILLKIYRILAEFQTRKAHRVCVRDRDLLKYLLGIILVVVGYLSAWTAVVMDNIAGGFNIVVQGRTSKGLKYIICRALWWDYVTEVGEELFLLLGVFLTYRVRNAKGECFKEKCALSWSVYFEALVSLLMYTIRHVVWLNIEPDYIYLLYFLRCQLTVTIVLFLIFGPKLWYHHRPPDPVEYQQGRHLSTCDVHDHMPETMKLHEAITSNGEVDFSEINISDMDPEDIRAELRRVYTQLQVLRNITMRKENPHISRRRGGRKGTHRRFSLQTFHHRHKHFHDQDHETTEVSKTPEDSTASGEGAPAETTKPDEATSTPSVTFKEGLK